MPYPASTVFHVLLDLLLVFVHLQRLKYNTQAMGFAARSVLVFFFVWLA